MVSRRISAGGTLVLTLLLAAPTAFAADDSQDVPAPDALEDELNLDDLDFGDLDLDDEFALLAEENIVVSASKRPQAIAESPSTITVFTRDQLMATGVRDIHDILRMVPGFDVHLATVSWPMIGARAGSTEASDLLVVLLDGREIATASLGIPLLTALPVPMEAIERIEVIRGPGSTLYGANAYQGVVNIITERPGAETGVRAVLRGGLQDSFGAWVVGDAGVGKLRLAPSLGVEQAGSFFETGEPRRIGRGRLRLTYKLSEDSELDGEVGATFLSGPAYTGLGPQQVERYLSPHLRLEWRRGDFRLSAWGNLFSVRTDMDLGLRLVGLDGTVEEMARLRTTDGEETVLLEEKTGELSSQYAFDWSIGEWLASTAVMGATVRLSHFSSNASVTECPEPFTSSVDCETGSITEARAGLFLQNESRLGHNFLLTLGIRVDANTIQATPFTGSPRASLVWQPHRNHSLRASYGRAYRKPTILEGRAHLRMEGTYPAAEIANRVEEIFATQVGNEDVKPEILEAIELGYRGTFLDGELQILADLWAYRSSDAIYFRVDMLDTFLGVPTIKPDAVMTFQNLEDPERHVGFELTLLHAPLPWLSYGGVYAWRHSLVEVEVEIVPFSPAHGVDLWARVGKETGPRAWLHLDWVSSYDVTVRDPRSSISDPIAQELGNRSRLTVTGAWRFAWSKGANLEVGILGSDLLSGIDALGGGNQREYAGCPGEGCPAGYEAYVGEPLGAELSLFVRGAY